jgi:hypothetical protein
VWRKVGFYCESLGVICRTISQQWEGRKRVETACELRAEITHELEAIKIFYEVNP